MRAWLSKHIVLLALALIVIASLLAIGWLIYVRGGAAEKLNQATEQIKVNTQLRKADEKIDRTAPDGSDKPAAIEWLRHHTRQQ